MPRNAHKVLNPTARNAPTDVRIRGTKLLVDQPACITERVFLVWIRRATAITLTVGTFHGCGVDWSNFEFVDCLQGGSFSIVARLGRIPSRLGIAPHLKTVLVKILNGGRCDYRGWHMGWQRIP